MVELGEILENWEYIYKHGSPDTIKACAFFISNVKDLIKLGQSNTPYLCEHFFSDDHKIPH